MIAIKLWLGHSNYSQELAKALIENGANVDAKDSHRRTPLSYAAGARGGGAELETKSKYGQTPLLYAAWKGHEAVVKLLLEKGAELETKSRHGQTQS